MLARSKSDTGGTYTHNIYMQVPMYNLLQTNTQRKRIWKYEYIRGLISIEIKVIGGVVLVIFKRFHFVVDIFIRYGVSLLFWYVFE